MKKFLICLTILTSLQPVCSFADVPDEATEKAIELEEKKENAFNEGYISRQNFVCELLSAKRTNFFTNNMRWLYGNYDFEDMPKLQDYPHTPDEIQKLYNKFNYINQAKEAGIINGYPDGTFHPDKPITREDMYLMIYKYLKSGKIKFKDGKSIKEPDLKILDKYADKNDLSPWVAEGISVLINMGIYKPFEDKRAENKLDLRKYVTYAEAVNVIDNFYDNYFEKYIS